MAKSGETKACRLCLVTDCNLLAVDIQLESSMRSILGQNISYKSGLPKYACDECAAFLKRFKEFRQKCLIAQTVLYNILKAAGQVTETEIRKINRKRLNLIRSTPPLPQKDIPFPASEEEPCQIELVNVKEEPELEMDVEEQSEDEDVNEDKEDKSNVDIQFETDNEGLLKPRNPLEEYTYMKKEITLPEEEADMCKGFTVTVPLLSQVESCMKSKRKGKVKSRSYMEFRQSENARKRRFLDKMTPEQRALKRERDLKYYHRRKAEKNLVVSSMSEDEKSKRREQWKKSSRKYREKKREINVE